MSRAGDSRGGFCCARLARLTPAGMGSPDLLVIPPREAVTRGRTRGDGSGAPGRRARTRADCEHEPPPLSSGRAWVDSRIHRVSEPTPEELGICSVSLRFRCRAVSRSLLQGHIDGSKNVCSRSASVGSGLASHRAARRPLHVLEIRQWLRSEKSRETVVRKTPLVSLVAGVLCPHRRVERV